MEDLLYLALIGALFVLWPGGRRLLFVGMTHLEAREDAYLRLPRANMIRRDVKVDVLAP